MKVTVVALVTLGTLVTFSVHASPADSTCARGGVPLYIAKRLGGCPAEPATSAIVPVSGVPMREATVRLGQDRGPPTAPSLAPAHSGVPLSKAKRL